MKGRWAPLTAALIALAAAGCGSDAGSSPGSSEDPSGISIDVPASPATPASPAASSDGVTGKRTGQPQAATPADKQPEGGQLTERVGGRGETGRSKAGGGSASVTKVRTDGSGRRKGEGGGAGSVIDQTVPAGGGRSKRRSGQTVTSP